ncbi:MAG: site-specific DNA-methyltransferase [Gammaproteobacteria bacterium]|nr:site-specific DNA-methyltransferase [Gammaproteobacteria bacterium]MXW46375.1 site-specific DNA-methyltransferase [Gammaproteobacteria bacterium]MYD01240.1 site-specific DNA-methyltransferase [Gammaproteobacteria bacterium]MYI26374.1 site-specific DNA-methyltransferase [Gammaproteobacteria bacterium]
MVRKRKRGKQIETLTHSEESRRNIPTSELESLVRDQDKTPLRIAYERRNRDLDPQLVWRGKDEQDWSDLVVQAPPLYIQEKVQPKALVDDLLRESRARVEEEARDVPDLFVDFNGLPSPEAATEFYQHDQNWSNRMILGDSLQVMASLAEREGLRGKVQCIYIDPPYGIKFNSNFQWSTTSRDVKDGKRNHITREPEQVKAFRDTWRDGIHSYLTYLRDRLTVARDLLTESGSVFVQIGDENVHRVRAVMDEVFGTENFVSMLSFRTHSPLGVKFIASPYDYILWFGKDRTCLKFRNLWLEKPLGSGTQYQYVQETDGTRRSMSASEKSGSARPPKNARVYRLNPLRSTGYTASCTFDFAFEGSIYPPPSGRSWATTADGMRRVVRAGRAYSSGTYLNFLLFHNDFSAMRLSGAWSDTYAELAGSYVVQTSVLPIQRCMLMTTDPGDLVLDPTCGSGTTAYVAEQWGRRWITIDTSRVALALARARIMGARYPYYLLADSRAGQLKEAQITRKAPSEAPVYGSIRQGFVYERVPHITLKAIANNAEIDVIYENRQPAVEDALAELNAALRGHPTPFQVSAGGRKGEEIHFDADKEAAVELPSGESVAACALLEWEVPREAPEDWPDGVNAPLARFWEARIERQREIDASIAASADFEYLYDKPYEDKSKVRVAGPFTVESLTPHRTAEASPARSVAPLADEVRDQEVEYEARDTLDAPAYDFTAIILEQLRTAGVQQADKRHKIDFTSLEGWPGELVCADGRYSEGDKERRAAILVGPEHGTVGRADLTQAAREAAEAGFDALIACAFNYDAQSSEVTRLGKLPVLKARMNADLHMSTDLKKTKAGNLFVIFGEPDIEVLDAPDDRIQVRIKGIDLFDPRTGEVRSSEPDDLACWFIDTDYDMASFFVRHAYFLGTRDPYKALKTTLKAEIDKEAWASLRSDTSRPFNRPVSGRIAVKAINHLGDEVMKVVKVAPAKQ